MNKLFIFMIVLLIANLGFAESRPVVYNDHGRRDPMSPLVSSFGLIISYDGDLSLNDLNLEGTMADATGGDVAIINGRIVKAHDHVGPYVVESIVGDHVELLKGTESFMLRMKKGGV